MTALLSTFGAMAFGAMAMIIFIIGKEFTKVKNENKQLHKDLDQIMQLIPNLSSSELDQIVYQNVNETEEIKPCQKS